MIDSEVHTDLKLLKASQIFQSFVRDWFKSSLTIWKELNLESQMHYDSVKLPVQMLVPGRWFLSRYCHVGRSAHLSITFV